MTHSHCPARREIALPPSSSRGTIFGMDAHRDNSHWKRMILRSLAFIGLAFADFMFFNKQYPELWFFAWFIFIVLAVIALGIIAASLSELVVLAIQAGHSVKPPVPKPDAKSESN